jgi:hypothetical protein
MEAAIPHRIRFNLLKKDPIQWQKESMKARERNLKPSTTMSQPFKEAGIYAKLPTLSS